MGPRALPPVVAVVIDGPEALLPQPRALAPRELGRVAELEGRVNARGHEAVTLLQRLREEGVPRREVQVGERADGEGELPLAAARAAGEPLELHIPQGRKVLCGRPRPAVGDLLIVAPRAG